MRQTFWELSSSVRKHPTREGWSITSNPEIGEEFPTAYPQAEWHLMANRDVKVELVQSARSQRRPLRTSSLIGFDLNLTHLSVLVEREHDDSPVHQEQRRCRNVQ